MSANLHSYLEPIKNRFEAAADVENALHMRAYLKDQFVFYGIKATERKELFREHLSQEGEPELSDLDAIVKDAWALAHREYQYFAMDLLARYAKKLDKDGSQLIEWCIVNKSWWDTVDHLAIKCAGAFLKAHPGLIKATNKKWINSKNMWLRRSALLFQIKYKADTDQKLLFANIEATMGTKEFFINKAIGWSLREYAKTAPKEVKAFVKAHPELATLSKREAVRNL